MRKVRVKRIAFELVLSFLSLFFAKNALAHDSAALLALVPNYDVVAVQSGNWSDANTWDGKVPEGNIFIPAGLSVVIDEDVDIDNLSVSGTLSTVTDRPINISLENFVGLGHSVINIEGTVNVLFKDTGDLVNLLSRGLISEGEVHIHGYETDWYTLYVGRYGHEVLPSGQAPSIEYLYSKNLGRSIVFKSQNPAVNRRGHIMLMHSGLHSVDNALLIDLGRTNKAVRLSATNVRGRYALHLHRNDQSKQIEVNNVVVIGSPGWGVVNHSSNVYGHDSVCYNALGAGFVTEVGNELGSFEYNIAGKGIGNGTGDNHDRLRNEKRKDISDYGYLGHGFWIQSPKVATIGNVAFEMRGTGFDYYIRSYKEPDTGITPIHNPQYIKLAENRDNVALNNEIGMTHSYGENVENTMQNFTAINNEVGYNIVKSVIAVSGSTFVENDIGYDSGDAYGGPTLLTDSTFQYNNIGLKSYSGSPFLGPPSVVTRGVWENNTVDVFMYPSNGGSKAYFNELGDVVYKYGTVLHTGAISQREMFFHKQKTGQFFVDNHRIYSPEQHPDFIPFKSGTYANLTNQQIFDTYGKKPYGELIPPEAVNMGNYYIMP